LEKNQMQTHKLIRKIPAELKNLHREFLAHVTYRCAQSAATFFFRRQTMIPKRPCPNCGTPVAVFITEVATQRRFCHHCSGRPQKPASDWDNASKPIFLRVDADAQREKLKQLILQLLPRVPGETDN
jgi:hypothetical protein